METTEIVSILFDLNSYNWSKYHYTLKEDLKEASRKSKPFSRLQFEEILELAISHLIFCVSQSENNQVLFYYFNESECELIFPCDNFDRAYVKMMNYSQIRTIITTRIMDALTKMQLDLSKSSRLITAMSKSLCALNKMRISKKMQFFVGRILIFLNSEFKNDSFNQLMSCVFVCQQRNYIIDAVVLNKKTQNFLLQATIKTNGFYFPCNPDKGMIQAFLHVFNIRSDERRSFKMPNFTKTYSEASCRCHSKKIDLAWICSVCLAIYCEQEKQRTDGECRFCGSLYDLCDFNQDLLLDPNSSVLN